jgi:hypothetical protein
MYIKCIYCDTIFRNNFYLSQHYINNFCDKYNLLLLQINDKDNKDNKYDKYDKDDKDTKITIYNIKLKRLERRKEINKYIDEIKKIPDKDVTYIDMLCKEIVTASAYF